MKRTLYFVMALALVLGFTQCKKEQIEPQSESNDVHITLDLKKGGSNGSRVEVDPPHVTFEEGDQILVGYNNAYVGTLIHNGTRFEGNIDATVNGTQKLYFYFVGNKNKTGAAISLGDNTYTVDISDQMEELPVLSFSASNEDFVGAGSYTAVLQNQCALVKFTTASTTDPVHVGGLYTGATINFGTTPGITNNGTTGFVNLHPDAEDNEAKWAVLLPQTGFEGAEAAIAHVGYTTTIPTISADGFITGDAAVSISTQSNIVYLDWLTGDYTATDGKILTGTLNGEPQPYKINVNTDGATVTLRNSTINGKNDKDNCSWPGITCENNTTLVIEGTNNVTGFYENYPGIHIASGKTLTIQGTGTLNASSNGGTNGWGAGIGGGPSIVCGNIVINSGTINATGGKYEAGIGGGYSANCGSITINGGNVTATGGKMGAGIGGGTYGSCGSITINGGDVTATGGEMGAGIGGGYSANCGSITINGGNVTAYGGIGAAGIGTGLSQVTITGGGISITGGTVVATGGIGAAGIGSGFAAYGGDALTNRCGNISITGGQVTAIGGNGGNSAYNDLGVTNSYYYGGAGIGTGSTNKNNSKSSCGTITIGSGVTRVTATKGGGTYPATNSIGKNESTMNQGTCGTVTIGGNVGAITQSPYTYQP